MPDDIDIDHDALFPAPDDDPEPSPAARAVTPAGPPPKSTTYRTPALPGRKPGLRLGLVVTDPGGRFLLADGSALDAPGAEFDPARHVAPVPEGAYPRGGTYRPAFTLPPDSPPGEYEASIHELDGDGRPLSKDAPALATVHHDPTGKLDESGRPFPEVGEAIEAPAGPLFNFNFGPGGGLTFRRGGP